LTVKKLILSNKLILDLSTVHTCTIHVLQYVAQA
jgi:hypothetical protein